MLQFLAAAAPLIGSAISGGLDYLGQERANDANREMANENKDFQERMSNTAHQRHIKDLKAAGLNPILSANTQGAGTPNPQLAHFENSAKGVASSFQNISQGLSAKATADATREQLITQKTQQAVNSAQAANIAEDAKRKFMENSVIMENMDNAKYVAKRRGKNKQWLGWEDDAKRALDIVNPFKNYNASQVQSESTHFRIGF